MKKLITLLFLAVVTLSGCSNNESNNYNNNTNTNMYSNNYSNTNISNTTNTATTNSTSTNNVVIEKVSTADNKENTNKEEEISSFSTKVIDKSKDRKTNVDITVSKINGYKLEPRSNIFILRNCRKSHS